MSEASGCLENNGLDPADAKPLGAQMSRGAFAICLEGGNISTEARQVGRPGAYAGLRPDLLEGMDAHSAGATR